LYPEFLGNHLKEYLGVEQMEKVTRREKEEGFQTKRKRS
jgi:hypothetical protein